MSVDVNATVSQLPTVSVTLMEIGKISPGVGQKQHVGEKREKLRSRPTAENVSE